VRSGNPRLGRFDSCAAPYSHLLLVEPHRASESVQQSATIDLACNNLDVTITADTNAVVDESNEDNNVLGKTF
jgi:hypothetical protein